MDIQNNPNQSKHNGLQPSVSFLSQVDWAIVYRVAVALFLTVIMILSTAELKAYIKVFGLLGGLPNIAAWMMMFAMSITALLLENDFLKLVIAIFVFAGASGFVGG